MSKEDRDLAYALWAMKILTDAGAGIETAIKHVAESDYGELSNSFKKLLKEGEGGLEKGFKTLIQETKNDALKEVFTALWNCTKQDIQISDTLKTLAERASQKRKNKIKHFIEKLNTVAEMFLTIGIILPILVVILPFMGSISGGLPSMEENKIVVDPFLLSMVNLILIVILIVSGMIVFWVKTMESNL